MSYPVIGGIEGGATKTIVFLMNTNGEKLAETTGSDSNPWNLGVEQCCKLIYNLVMEAKRQAKLLENEPLHSLGLCLSGLETEDIRNKLKNTLISNYPRLSDNYFIGSDTRAPLAMVNDIGGIVLIAGTGSNCLLINPDESETQCGGFGDKLGDEGSAYWIVHRGVKICLDNNIKLKSVPNGYSDVKLWEAIKKYFNIETIYDLIPIFYSHFNKAQIAALCISLSELARNGDPLSKWLFESAGQYLAKHIQAVYNSAHETLKCNHGGLQIVCVGSVWKSWDLLKQGFEAQLKDTSVSDVYKLCLVHTTGSSAIGAVYLAARVVNVPFPYTFSKNYNVFYEYVK
ncbi:hypothetical protein PGB90_001317 [Kerria lacca]